MYVHCIDSTLIYYKSDIYMGQLTNDVAALSWPF